VHLVSPTDDQLQCAGFNGFLVKIMGAQSHCPQCVRLIPVARYHNDLSIWSDRKYFLEGSQTLFDAFRIRRQTKVLEYNRRLVPPQLRQCGLAILAKDHFVTLEAPAQLTLQSRIILDDQ